MKYWRLWSAVAVMAALFISVGCVRKRESISIKKSSPKGTGKLYFLPLGDFPAETVKDLVSFYERNTGWC